MGGLAQPGYYIPIAEKSAFTRLNSRVSLALVLHRRHGLRNLAMPETFVSSITSTGIKTSSTGTFEEHIRLTAILQLIMDQIQAPLKGKVAVVTGGSRGLGAGIALKLAEQGCSHIAITYNASKAKAEEVLQAIHTLSPKIKTHAFAADLLRENFGQHVVDLTLSGLGVDHIDIVIANATNTEGDKLFPVSKLTRKQWDDDVAGNAWSSIDLARCAVLKMPPGGRIIMISSGASKMPLGELYISYGAAKAALESISKNLAATWGMQYGITVNSISVGATLTEGLRKSMDAAGEEFEQKAKEMTMLKRHGEVEEVANIVAFVASPAASWIIGEYDLVRDLNVKLT